MANRDGCHRTIVLDSHQEYVLYEYEEGGQRTRGATGVATRSCWPARKEQADRDAVLGATRRVAVGCGHKGDSIYTEVP